MADRTDSSPPVLDHIHFDYILVKIDTNMKHADMDDIEYSNAVIRNCMSCLVDLNSSPYDMGSVGQLAGWHLLQINKDADIDVVCQALQKIVGVYTAELVKPQRRIRR